MDGKVESTLSKLKGKVKDLKVPPIDKTLTKEDACAEAKATGEAIDKALEDAKTYANEHKMDLSGGVMTGDINMAGHSINGIPNAVEDGDLLTLAFARTLFSPIGYGYGGEIPDHFVVSTDAALHEKLDELLAKMPFGASRNITFTHVGEDVVNGVAGLGGNGKLFGCLYKGIGIEDSTYAHLMITSYTGRIWQMYKTVTWSPVEWFNPPMELGVEYRTTERYENHPVYAKLFDFGALPNTTNKDVQFSTEAKQCIRGTVQRKDGGVLANRVGSYEFDVYFSKQSLRIWTSFNATATECNATAWYTKE